jgi:hypothetical protein
MSDAALYHIIRWSVEKEMGNHGKSPSYRWSNEGILPGLSGCRNSRTLEGHDPTGRIWTVTTLDGSVSKPSRKIFNQVCW